MEQKEHKISKGDIAFIIIIALFIAIPFALNRYSKQYVEKEYTLCDMGDGVYAYYTNVSSAIPAQNYEMVSVCANGNVITLKGSINISYVSDNFRMMWKDTNTVNGDTITIYVPKNSVEFMVNISVG